MKISQSAFNSVAVTPHPVVPMGDRWIYFAKQGAIDANVMPISLQEQQDKQTVMGLLMLDASEALANERGITPEEAYKMFFTRVIEGTTVEGISALRYLKGELRTQYLAAAKESSSLPIKSATLMIRHRMLFSIHVAENAKPSSKQLSIDEPWFCLEVGAKVKLDGQTVTITEPYDPESGLVGITKLARAVEAGTAGFLMQADGKRYEMGDPEWTEEQTLSLSIENADGSDSQIERIYQFYIAESGRAPMTVPAAEETEGNEQLQIEGKSSSASSNPKKSTGTNSTGESSPTESATSVSALPTSELALAG